jgi:hypothetical protein
MVGKNKKHLSRAEICLQVSIDLGKNIVPETDKLTSQAYKRVSVEFQTLGVSPWYVGQI